MTFPYPENELQRLAKLRDFDILDSAAEQEFDDTTSLIASICGTPIALISLVDESRQWFKSRYGLTVAETPRESAFCAHAICGQELFMVPNALDDPRFADNPLVLGDPNIRFYAGAPLVTTTGEALGALCVIDRVPRQLNEQQQTALRVLSQHVMTQIQLRRQVRELKRTEAALLSIMEDQTRTAQALRESEQALQTSEERWQFALEGSEQGVWDWNLQTNEIFFSDHWKTMLGYAPDEIPHRLEEWSSRVHPDDLEPTLNLIREHLEGRRDIYISDHRMRHKEGEYRWIHDRGKVITFSADGRPLRMVGTHTDITEYKRAEHALRTSESAMSTAQRIAHFGHWELDLQPKDRAEAGRLFWSTELFRIAGLEPTQTITRDFFFSLVHPEDRQAIKQAVAQAIREGIPYSIVHRLTRPDGEERIIHEIAELMFDERTGQPIKMIGVAHDITDQRMAEQALRKSDQEHRKLAQELEVERTRLVMAQKVAKVGSWETDIATLKVIWSEETHRIFETDPLTFQPNHISFLELVHPEDRAFVDASFVHSLDNTSPRMIEHRLLLPGGRIKHVEERWQSFHDAQGRPLRCLGTCRDITEQKLAEVEIRKAANLLQAVTDSTPDAIFVKDLQGRYLLFNEGAAQLVGKASKDVIGQDDTFVFGPESARVVQENDRQVMQTGKVLRNEEILTAAGVTRIFLATKAPYRDDRGNTIGLVGISRDITENKLAEEKLREQATLLDKAQDAILVRDLNHGILYWNQSAERLYGWPAQEVIGRSIKELLYLEPTEFLKATEATIIAGEWTGELQQVKKDGSPLSVEARWTLVRDEQGQPKSILAINTDITERKKLENQFLRAQRMESIGTLAGGIAHDLNNVLTPVMMSIELLKIQEQNTQRLNILNTIETSAKRGADMVKQVLSFARGVEGHKEQVSLSYLMKEVDKICNETFLKSIKVQSHIPDNLWMTIGDPTQLHQVLINLCVNARDAMPNGGTLTLSASNKTLDEHFAGMHIEANPGPYVIIQVDDNGTGMPPHVVERIFDPFFTTKELGKGTGLGLSTSIAIIKSHGGFIRVNSEVGVGTRFRIYLPAIQAEVSTGRSSAPNELPLGHGELILVVDDEEAVRHITQQTLEAFGYRVLLASDGAEATALYVMQKDAISVVLTDMMMPNMDGHATIPVLLRMNPQARIIAASGLNANGMAARATTAGVKQFIPKPYTAETLLNTVHEVLMN